MGALAMTHIFTCTMHRPSQPLYDQDLSHSSMAALKAGRLLAGALGVVAGVTAAPGVVFADKKEDAAAKAMFDPEALERGAAALREINKSTFGKQVRAPRS